MIDLNVFAQTSWLIPCYPLLGMALSIFWSPAFIRRMGPRPVGYLNIATTILALVHSVVALVAVWGQPAQYLSLSWLQVADLQLTLPLELSALTLGASVVVTVLNLLVQVYAIGYLEMDWGWGRLYSLLALFEAGMTTLVLCDSLFFSYILLEILTLGTYLIVGFWFNQSLVVTGARDAFLTKRVGDLILLMGVLALFPLSGTWSFTELGEWARSAGDSYAPLTISLIGLALVAGPVSKCAQFPLHLWLDEAMEGPLPTTILRNSVVVATGAWVLAKLEPVVALSPIASGTAVAIGAISAVGGALIAAAQIDIKRVLSYLASAYMGLIFIAIGTGQTTVALLLVLANAIATALLLMGAGSIILGTVTQDLTQMGGLWSRRPVTGFSLAAGIAGLIALPPFGGFWPLMEMVADLWERGQFLTVAAVLIANGVMTFALVRMFGLIFAGDRTPSTARAPEPIWLMTIPMTLMAGFTLHLPLILNRLGLLPAWNSVGAIAVTISSFAAIALGSAFYITRTVQNPTSLIPRPANEALAYDFYTSKLYQITAISFVDKLSQFIDWTDRYVLDGLANAVGATSLFGGETLKRANVGKAQVYALTITSFLVMLSLFLTWGHWTGLMVTVAGGVSNTSSAL